MTRWTHFLTVSYPTSGEGSYSWGTLDPQIVGAVGKLDCERNTADGRRVLVFAFSTTQAAQHARARVLGMHKKGVRTEVR